MEHNRSMDVWKQQRDQYIHNQWNSISIQISQGNSIGCGYITANVKIKTLLRTNFNLTQNTFIETNQKRIKLWR